MLTESPVKTRNQASELLKRLAHLTALLGAAAAARDMDVLKAQEKHGAVIKQLSDEITLGKKHLEAWAQENREEFGESKSIEFPNGWLRFRMGGRALDLMARWTWDKVLEKIQSFGVTSQWAEYVRVKKEVNKQRILSDCKTGGQLPAARLREVGLKVIQEERFEVECKPEMAIAEMPCL